MKQITEIILHCSATVEGANFKAADITRWHKQRGFTTIGYNFVIDLDGTIEMGRSIMFDGAHTVGHNKNSIGICYIGGLDKRTNKPKDTRTTEQNESFKILLRLLHKMFPSATLHGHNEFANKACPCFDVHDYDFIMNN